MKIKTNKGFSLVELIVVIAIMAIIAAVAVPVYSTYIDKANKGNDIALVGEVINALEIGANSGAFVPGDSLNVSEINYPVGFVVLTQDGLKVLTSGTTVVKDDTPCSFETATVKRITSKEVTQSCGLTGLANKTKTVYTIIEEKIKYCKNHGDAPTSLETEKNYLIRFDGCGNSGFHLSHQWDSDTTNEYKLLPSGTLIADSSVKVVSSDPTKCEYAYGNSVTFGDDHKVNGANGLEMDTSHPLYKALEAAYGDLSQVKLNYDKWTSTEGIDYATFYTYGPTLMEDLEEMSGILATVSKQNIADVGLTQSYENGEAVLIGVSENITKKHTASEWDRVWLAAGDKSWESYGFELSGRENYAAARAGYNSAFASYLISKGIEDTYANIIKDFSKAVSGIDAIQLPVLVSTSAFTDSNSGLKAKFEDAGDDGTVFELCKKYFNEYKTSKACVENGKVLYNSMKTFQSNADFAVSSGDVFEYYNTFVDEIASLYEAAQTMADGGIIIIVNSNKGVITYDVAPSEADPRN